MNSGEIALFPLNAHVFPRGKLSLRIFEARYLRMIKSCCGNSPAFAMGMMHRDITGNTTVLDLATLVNIVDFNRLENGLLGITVEGQQLITIDTVSQDSDGLHRATYHPIELWTQPVSGFGRKLILTFEQLLDEYEDIGQLYRHVENKNVNWYVGRWLELLPIDAELKISLLMQPSPAMAIHLIESMIKQSDP